jgi:guanosine-3',5'-bis(diphosphate) 3'-pyrophosphohydrolase
MVAAALGCNRARHHCVNEPTMQTELMTARLENAFRWAADRHRGQTRRGGDTPYFEHVAAVALVVDRAGFDEDVVIAGLLHDVIEDTGATLEDVAARFGPAVAQTVGHCSEVKSDAQGNKRPWIDRKRDHLAAMAQAPLAARAVILADKLHNLVSIEHDLRVGRPVWPVFHASKERVLWYYRIAVDTCGHGDPRVERLALACRCALARVEVLD